MGVWRIRLVTGTAMAACYAAALEELCSTVSWIDMDEDGLVEVEAITEEGEPDRETVMHCLQTVAEGAGVVLPEVRIEPLPDEDWLAMSYRSFPPRTLGRYWIYGSHVTEDVPEGLWPLMIDAATAFGSGEHPTTAGCLLAIERLADEVASGAREKIVTVLDMGTGSGILSVAAVRAFGAGVRVTAVDIDPESIRMTGEHARANGVASFIAMEAGDGFNTPVARANAPYDLLLANILAGPLCEMAEAGAAVVKADGVIVLAGLLNTQAEAVIAAWAAQGCSLVSREEREEWTILVLVKS